MSGTLYTYRYRHPAYPGVDQTVDCWSLCAPRALRAAQRFIRRENTRLRRAGIKTRVRMPRTVYDLRWL